MNITIEYNGKTTIIDERDAELFGVDKYGIPLNNPTPDWMMVEEENKPITHLPKKARLLDENGKVIRKCFVSIYYRNGYSEARDTWCVKEEQAGQREKFDAICKLHNLTKEALIEWATY